MANRAEIGALLRQAYHQDTQEGDREMPTDEKPQTRRISRRQAITGIAAIAAGTVLYDRRAPAAQAEVPGKNDAITLTYGQVNNRTISGQEEEGNGPHVLLSIFPSSDINVTRGTIWTLSEEVQRYPGSKNPETKRVSDVVRVTEPGEPLTLLQIAGYAHDLDPNDFGGLVELRPGKTFAVTIFEPGESPLETAGILAQKEDIVPPFTHPTP